MIRILVILLLCLCGCAQENKSTCVDNAKQQATFYSAQGYEIRYGHGWYDGKPHCWLERQDWIVCNDTVGNCKDKPVDSSYKVKFYGYPKKEE